MVVEAVELRSLYGGMKTEECMCLVVMPKGQMKE